MKKTTTFLISLLIGVLSFAQQGINYKALITDNGSIVANQSVTIRFTILENGITNGYQEEHTVTTTTDGIAIVNIGEGTQISGDFNTIDWRVQVFLKTEINIGSGYVDFGTTGFKTVPHAKSAEKLLPTDKVIIGETDTYATEKLYVKNANPNSELVDFRVGDLTSGKDVLNLYIEQNSSGSGSNNRSQFIEATKGSSLKFKVDDDGRIFSKQGLYTDGYLEATGTIESYSKIKSWGDLEVDGNLAVSGEVTTDLEMGTNEIHGASTGNADMKAFMYGSFFVGQNGLVGLNTSASSVGFTVSRYAYGKYKIQFDDTNLEIGQMILLISISKSEFDNTPTLINARTDYNDSYFYIEQYDLNGNAYEGDPGVGYDAYINFVIYKK